MQTRLHIFDANVALAPVAGKQRIELPNLTVANAVVACAGLCRMFASCKNR